MSAVIIEFPTPAKRREADRRAFILERFPHHDETDIANTLLLLRKMDECEARLAADPEHRALLQKARAAIAQLPRREG